MLFHRYEESEPEGSEVSDEGEEEGSEEYDEESDEGEGDEGEGEKEQEGPYSLSSDNPFKSPLHSRFHCWMTD